MKIVGTVKEVREQVKEWKKQGLSVGLVPTMGYLHEGHKSLMEAARKDNDKVVVSIFVNPMQFGPTEDLATYPRDLDHDAALCESVGVDLIFHPEAEEMYEKDFCSFVDMTGLTEGLCGKTRPIHFRGVCTVVNKLFNIVQPDFAFFGEKDRQQLIILKKMVKDLNIPVQIIPCPIVREESGLALSSRNKYLSEEDKVNALALSKILFNIKACFKKGITDVKALTEIAYPYLNENHSLEYLEFRDGDDLEEKQVADDNTIVFIALKIGNVRLIDNVALGN